ncbi:hypothetical protein AUTU_42240 (plasmid) [Aureibacter tunicatorum]|nr:hypothetical protein AUTU_42240 [Aureibacter tunicatorum]
MRIFFIAIISLFTMNIAYPQAKKMSAEQKLNEYLAFEDIDYEEIAFRHDSLARKTYTITISEYRKGKPVKNEIIFDSREIESDMYKFVGDSILNFVVFAKTTMNNELKLNIRTDLLGINKLYKLRSKEDYELNMLSFEDLEGKIFDKEIPFMTYHPPKSLGGESKSWCAVMNDQQNYDKWCDRHNLKHYYVFTMRFE